MRRGRWTGRLAGLLGFGLLALGSGAHAQQGFNLNPVVVNLDPARTLNGALTFTNTSTEAVTVQASVVEWQIRDGEDVDLPTRDVQLNPTRFTVGPGESQVLRFGLRRKPTAGELTYRIVLAQQAPEVKAAGVSDHEVGDPTRPDSAPALSIQLNELFLVRLPLYVTPQGTSAQMGYTLERQGDVLRLRLTNTGNRHQTLYDLTLRRGDQVLDFPPNAVLSGAQLTYQLAGWGALGGPLDVSYRNQDGEQIRVQPPLP
ncbi:fimbrial biogenesis chaperone [Deinococcus hopiensis]|uniref:Fimbrial chaperone protein n=1 Tax=Deinococcus hopiensis KR-140 TaxID=695939 RepID=A0A1W1UDP1_9DEIO|nr:fimbria/pilus periplasmic chaperone [Deinococcus hopiensis]SMB79170.1 fimbrial chaperone protein [Deinococcus hopiensis KR-140]